MSPKIRTMTYIGQVLILAGLLIDTPSSWVVWLVIAVIVATVAVDAYSSRTEQK